MKIYVELNERDILGSIEPRIVAEYFKNHRDIDELLEKIGFETIMRFLRETRSTSAVLNELAQVDDIESHITECRVWALKQKKEVG